MERPVRDGRVSSEELLMMIACIKSGTYFIISTDDFRVVGEVTRLWKKAPRGPASFWPDGYVLKWVDTGEDEYYQTLKAIHERHNFENYPGYNAILQGQKVKRNELDTKSNGSGRLARAPRSARRF
jgi:hypothetical protein